MRRSRHVVVMIHGFNVPDAAAVRAYAQFLQTLGASVAPAVPSDHATFVEYHWPGEHPRGAAVSAATYSLRVDPARRAGAALGALLATLPSSTTVTLVAHSLGNAALLTAVANHHDGVGARIADAYLLAAAVPARSCEPGGRFESRLAGVRYHALHSDRDTVLRFAFPPGQFLADGPAHGRPRAVGSTRQPAGCAVGPQDGDLAAARRVLGIRAGLGRRRRYLAWRAPTGAGGAPAPGCGRTARQRDRGTRPPDAS